MGFEPCSLGPILCKNFTVPALQKEYKEKIKMLERKMRWHGTGGPTLGGLLGEWWSLKPERWPPGTAAVGRRERSGLY